MQCQEQRASKVQYSDTEFACIVSLDSIGVGKLWQEDTWKRDSENVIRMAVWKVSAFSVHSSQERNRFISREEA